MAFYDLATLPATLANKKAVLAVLMDNYHATVPFTIRAKALAVRIRNERKIIKGMEAFINA